MLFRKTTNSDIAFLMPISEEARRTIAALGIDQWQNGYPSEEVVLADIEKDQSYLCELDGKVCGTFAMLKDGEPTYDKIYDGHWLTGDDSRDYIASGLLGANLTGIDNVLRWIYKKGGRVSVNYDKKDKLVTSTLDYFAKERGINITYNKNGEITVPKQEISLKSRILHSKLAYSIGLKLFPKGSKLRKKLKSEL